MSMNPEQVPTTWTAADETFFRAIDGIMMPTYTAGASALLSSYDSDYESDTTGAIPVTPAAIQPYSSATSPMVR